MKSKFQKKKTIKMAAATVAKNLKDRRQRQCLEEVFKKVKWERVKSEVQ